MMRGLLLVAAWSLTGCGVAGQPRPPGPLPPAAPTIEAAISTPDGVLLQISPPTTDIDGAPIEDPVTLHAHPAADCHGPPLARGAEGAVALPPLEEATAVRVVALRAERAGPPSDAITVRWSAPPPPPEAPLAFVDGSGAVQLSWLPPPPPVERVDVLRDGIVVATEPADAAMWTDEAPTGRHVYALVGLTPAARTGASKAVEVEVPSPRAPR